MEYFVFRVLSGDRTSIDRQIKHFALYPGFCEARETAVNFSRTSRHRFYVTRNPGPIMGYAEAGKFHRVSESCDQRRLREAIS